MNMTRSLKAIGALVVALAVIGVMSKAAGLSRGSASHSKMIHTATISPEELTRAAAPMPVLEIENYQ
jgi:hypothetical protein